MRFVIVMASPECVLEGRKGPTFPLLVLSISKILSGARLTSGPAHSPLRHADNSNCGRQINSVFSRNLRAFYAALLSLRHTFAVIKYGVGILIMDQTYGVRPKEHILHHKAASAGYF